MRFKTERLLKKEAIRYFESGENDGLSIEEILSTIIANYESMSRDKKYEAIKAMEDINSLKIFRDGKWVKMEDV